MNEDADTLYYWCDRYARSTRYGEEHPGDAYGDAELEYCRDNIARHLKAYE